MLISQTIWHLPPLLLLLFGTACGIPRDTAGTTEHVLQRGFIKAGLVADADTVDFGDAGPAGAEISAVSGFAESLGVDVEWLIENEHELMDELARGELDLVVGGIERASPWSAHVALSRPIAGGGSKALVAAFRKGENDWLLSWEQYLAREKVD